MPVTEVHKVRDGVILELDDKEARKLRALLGHMVGVLMGELTGVFCALSDEYPAPDYAVVDSAERGVPALVLKPLQRGV